MKSHEQIMTEIERLLSIEKQGVDENLHTIKRPLYSAKENAILHYWETKAARLALEWVLKNEPTIVIYDINNKELT